MDNSILNNITEAKEVKFSCQKTCGHLCCTFNYVLLDPVEIRQIARAGFRNHIFISTPFPFIPVIGKNSRMPLLMKPENYACPFMEIEEDIPTCILHDTKVKPGQCQAYPGGRIEGQEGKIEIISLKPEKTTCPPEAFKEGETVEEMVRRIPTENFIKRNQIALAISKDKELIKMLEKINFVQEFIIVVNTLVEATKQENLTVESFLNTYKKAVEKTLKTPNIRLLAEVISWTAKSYPVVPYEIGKALEDNNHPFRNIIKTLKIPSNTKTAVQFFREIKQVYFATAGITPEKLPKELEPAMKRSQVYQKIIEETVREVEINDT